MSKRWPRVACDTRCKLRDGWVPAVAKRILVVDDSNIMRELCGSILRKAGYEVVDAWDASQARTALKQGNIDLMLCDLNIPGVNGLDLVEAMRKEPAFAELPVVIISVERSSALLERAKRARVSEWVTKPYDAAKLLSLSERLVGPALSGS